MNLRARACARAHGLFIDRRGLLSLLTPEVIGRLRADIERRDASGVDCPSCGGPMRASSVNDVAVHGCPECGGLWFELPELHRHVHEVRQRAFGAGSFAARVDVHRDAAAFSPADVVAGLLTDYELEVEGPPSID